MCLAGWWLLMGSVARDLWFEAPILTDSGRFSADYAFTKACLPQTSDRFATAADQSHCVWVLA